MSLKKFFKNFFTKQEDDIQELNEQEKSDITIMKSEPSPKSIKKSWIYAALFVIMGIVMIGLAFGFSDDEKRVTSKAAIDANRELNSKPVTSDMLKDIPGSYEEQEEINRKKLEEERKKKEREAADKKQITAVPQEKPTPPSVPQQPKIPQYNNQLSAAEKARLIAIERRNKALESKIRFEFEKGSNE
ncbi:hypothetical protein [Phascolarctobacterium sp.]